MHQFLCSAWRTFFCIEKRLLYLKAPTILNVQNMMKSGRCSYLVVKRDWMAKSAHNIINDALRANKNSLVKYFTSKDYLWPMWLYSPTLGTSTPKIRGSPSKKTKNRFWLKLKINSVFWYYWWNFLSSNPPIWVSHKCT